MNGDSDLAIGPLSALKSEVAAEVVTQLRPLLLEAGAKSEDSWLDSKEAAAYLSLSRHAFYKLTQARKIRFWQETEGGKMYFKKSWLDEYRGENATFEALS